ncbi:MAG: hypothetical protein A2W38_06500, partial [Deltaproteobacteria bacterium RBG_19FT_COMBO_58_16]
MMIKKIYIPAFSVIIILLASFCAFADFYRYTDENGVVHITNSPRPGYSWVMGETKSAPVRTAVKKVPRDKLDELIYISAARHGVDPALVRAVVKAESDYDAGAVSTVGARGLMQLMPETARLMGVDDIHDPEQNIDGGTRYLTRLLDRFDWEVALALAAYNAGEGAVRRHGGVPPYSETQDFVEKVLGYY